MDLTRADLGLLLSLDALLRECHVSRAAQRLGLSQPALSAQLARLRDLFGDELLVPSGRRMLLTARAEALRAPLHELLDQLQGLVRTRQSFDPQADGTVFRVAASDFIHATLNLAARLAVQTPTIQLALLNFDAKRAWEQLEAGAADLLVCPERSVPPGATAMRLFGEQLVFCQRHAHPRGTGVLSLDAFCALDHILVSPDGGGFFGVTDEALAGLGRTRRVVTSVSSVMLVPSLVQTTDLVAALPLRMAQSWPGGLDFYEPPLPLPGFTVAACWHPRRQAEPAHQWLRAQLAACAQALLDGPVGKQASAG